MQVNNIQTGVSFEASPKSELMRMAKLQQELTHNQKIIKVKNRIISFDRKKINKYSREHSSENVLAVVEKIRANMIAALSSEKVKAQSEVDKLSSSNKRTLYLRRKEIRDTAKNQASEIVEQIRHPENCITYRSVDEFVKVRKAQFASIYPDAQKEAKRLMVSFHQAKVKKIENLIDFVANYRKPQAKAGVKIWFNIGSSF